MLGTTASGYGHCESLGDATGEESLVHRRETEARCLNNERAETERAVRPVPVPAGPESLEEALALIENLRFALATRSIIGQAHGIVMERYRLDAENAFALLKRLSSANEMKVSRLSEQIVAGAPVPGLAERPLLADG